MKGLLILAFCFVAAAADQKSIPGTVTGFRTAPFRIALAADSGDRLLLKFGPDTQVIQVPPGEHDLTKAAPVRITDILVGDRVLVTFSSDAPEARRIVLVSAADIARRNEAEQLDWRERGVSGIVTSKAGDAIELELRVAEGPRTMTVKIEPSTRIRRYAADSVKFTDAEFSSAEEIIPGDQLRARGTKSADGTSLAAEDLVFGTFLTRIGKITAVNAEAGRITIEDNSTHKLLTIRLTSDSQIKSLPDARAMFLSLVSAGGAEHGATPPQRFDVTKLLERLPVATIADLKTGTSVLVTSTRGSKPDEATAISLLANAEFMIQTAQRAAGDGVSAADAIGKLHGGVLAGPGGLSLPAIAP